MSKANPPGLSTAKSRDALLLDHLALHQQDACNVPEEQIGARLRQLRRKQKLSIRDLATKCGISVNTLSLIENNRSSPSLHTLKLLARGLGVALISLFEEDKPAFALTYQQHGHRPQIYFTGGCLEKLGEGLLPLGAEPILVTLDPGTLEAADTTHTGREFIYCLEGSASCIVNNQEYSLDR